MKQIELTHATKEQLVEAIIGLAKAKARVAFLTKELSEDFCRQNLSSTSGHNGRAQLEADAEATRFVAAWEVAAETLGVKHQNQ